MSGDRERIASIVVQAVNLALAGVKASQTSPASDGEVQRSGTTEPKDPPPTRGTE